MFSFARRALVILPVALAACSGGDASGTGPNTVAVVTVSSPGRSVSVGNTIQFNAIAKNASGTAIAGVTFAWQSSDSTLATVSNIGLVTAIAPGAVSITATVDGKSGWSPFTVLDVPVLTVDVTPATPNIGVTGSVVLTATPRDAAGRPLARPVTWTASDAAKLGLAAGTANRATVTGLGLGTGLTVTATVGDRSGVATINVVAATSPTITAVSPAPLVPGATATITGVHFDATIANNAITVDGLPAIVTAATATQLTFTVPAGGFTCSAARDVPVGVVSNALNGGAIATLDPALTVDLTAGQSIFFDASAAAGSCIKLPAKIGASYLLTLANGAESPAAAGAFLLSGVPTAAAALASRVAPPAAPELLLGAPPAPAVAAPLLAESDAIDPRAAAAAHARLLQRDRAITARRGGPRAAHAALATRRRIAAALAFNPQVGDTVNVRIDDLNNDKDCSQGFNQRARVVYVSAKTIIYDDLANPMAGQVDAEMRQMGVEFDNVTLPVETTNFGNPLAYDGTLGNKGHVLIFFSSKVNTYAGGNLLGFVNSCDFFPYDVSGNPVTQDTVSNEAAIFYAMVPTVGGTGVHSVAGWHSTLRPVLAHETKHIVSYAEKFQRNADWLEEAWLEEATAQTASEIYGRTYTGAAWRGDNPYATTVRCDLIASACPGDHPSVMLHHFGWLQDYLLGFSAYAPTMDLPEVYYGGAWSLVRYAVDQYAPVEADVLQAITQTTHVFGTANLALRTGASWAMLTSRWNTATALARFGTTPDDPRLTLPSWDQKGIYSGLHLDLASQVPREYPLRPDSAGFVSFQWSGVIAGGGAAVAQITGTQLAPFLLSLTSPRDVVPQSGNPLRIGIVRVR